MSGSAQTPPLPCTIYSREECFILLLRSLEKVHIRKLAHFLDIVSLHNFFVVEKHPRGRIFALHRFSNKSDVVAKGSVSCYSLHVLKVG